MDSYGTLSSTQDDTIRTLNECFGSGEKICNHFEVETYTWDVLPDGLKLELADSVERELRWALEQISRASDASEDRKSTRLNSSHVATSYVVLCLKKYSARLLGQVKL